MPACGVFVMQLDRALLDIAEIRDRMSAVQVFRGYRAEVAALSGGLAILTAVLQGRFVPEPARDLVAYVQLWSGVAAFATLATAFDFAVRWSNDPAGRERVRILGALRALAPCLVTGALTTGVIVRFAPELGWTLPALWSLLFAQGVFASTPLLPRLAWWIGAYYVAMGLLMLVFARGEQALAGWTMALTFGVGQILAAVALYCSLERRHVS
jgi:hypothetical protein